jgi:hypothetical protein
VLCRRCPCEPPASIIIARLFCLENMI